MERRIAQHHVQRLLLYPRQPIGCLEHCRALAQRGLPVLPRRLHRHVRLVDQGVLGIRVGQGAGDRQHAVAAAQVRHPRAAQFAGQVRQERPRADIQPLTAEHVGVVQQLQRRRVEAVAARVGRAGDRPFGHRRGQQAGLFLCQRGLHRADVLLHQVTGRPWQVLDHRPGNHLRTGRQVALQADQLFFEQGQGLGHAHQHPVERALPVFAGRHERHTVEWQAIACQVLF
ncbi:hypothetical protein D3C76_1126090 [compost metagenome]